MFRIRVVRFLLLLLMMIIISMNNIKDLLIILVICLLYLQISKKWSELDTTVVRGPGFYRCTINTYHPIISDLLALIGICISFFINLIPFFMGVFAHTLFGRACLPYKINYDEQYGMPVVTAQTYNS